jgi:hypothetical protein
VQRHHPPNMAQRRHTRPIIIEFAGPPHPILWSSDAERDFASDPIRAKEKRPWYWWWWWWWWWCTRVVGCVMVTCLQVSFADSWNRAGTHMQSDLIYENICRVNEGLTFCCR